MTKKIRAVVVIVLVLEAVCRLYLFLSIPPEHKPAGWESVRLFFSGGSYLGEFQGQKFLFYKPKNVFRIIAIGGSTTAGIHEYDETWPYKLSELLNKRARRGVKIEVINLAQRGISSAQEYYYLATHDFLSPDMVLLYDGYNDIVYSNATPAQYALRASKTYQLLEEKWSGQKIGSALYRNSALVNRIAVYFYRLKNLFNKTVIRHKWFGLGERNKVRIFENVEWYASHFSLDPELEKIGPGGAPGRISFKIGRLPVQYDAAVLTGALAGKDLFPEVYGYDLENIALYLKSKNIKGVFIYQPFLAEKLSRTQAEGFADVPLAGYSHFVPEADRHFVSVNAGRKEIARNTALKFGIHFWDAQNIFDGQDDKKVYLDNCHSTAEGLAIIADRLAAYLADNKLVP